MASGETLVIKDHERFSNKRLRGIWYTCPQYSICDGHELLCGGMPIEGFMRNRFLAGMLVCATGLAGDVLTYHNDNARTGQNLSETILTPANVGVNTFGKLFNVSLDGKVDAEPLYGSGVVFPTQGTLNALYVATEHDSVYAFDADTGAQLWKVTMLKTGESTSDTRSCSQVTPEIGVTSTPVIARTVGPK